MSCPACRFPVHEDQPQLRVHMGVIRDAEGFMVDLLPVFHRQCGAKYLIDLGRAKTEAQRTGNVVIPDNIFNLEAYRASREAPLNAAVGS